jgi:probable rRNA maturation factor
VILELVDRRRDRSAIPPEFCGDRWQQLQRLVAGAGGPAWAVDVVLVDDAEMNALNERFRGQREVTDVLSFSYLEPAGTGAPDLVEGVSFAAGDIWLSGTPGDENVGELVLAPGFIARRCAERNWSLAAEIPLLIVHGCLHLLGWDHTDPESGQAMRDQEAILLAEEGLTHPLRQRS